MRESPDGPIRVVDGHLRVEPGHALASEVAAIYRDFAVLCVQKQIRRALVKPGDDDSAGERALRTALSTMLVAGLPGQFRIALLTDTRSVATRYRDTVRDLRAAGVEVRMFDSEAVAAAWLSGSEGRAASAAA